MSNARSATRAAEWQGQNWIRPERRLAIYLRDGLACVWCGQAVEAGVVMTLDHVTTYAAGGGHESSNLVTACKRCNDSRGKRTIAAFARAVAAYLDHGADPEAIVARVRRCQRRAVDVAEAKAIIARRGTVRRALDNGGR